jgi:hypothetical protein
MPTSVQCDTGVRLMAMPAPRVRRAMTLDSLAQSCGLCASTFIKQRIGIMSHRKRLDFITGNCGVSLPTLLERIGIMAAHGQPPPTTFHAARWQRLPRHDLARHTGSPNAGPEVQARPPVKTTATSIASGPADRPAAAIRMKVAKRFSGPSMNQGMALRSGASSQGGLRRRHRRPLRPDLLKRRSQACGLDNRIRMGLVKLSRRLTDGPAVRRAYPSRHWREPMTARAGPID